MLKLQIDHSMYHISSTDFSPKDVYSPNGHFPERTFPNWTFLLTQLLNYIFKYAFSIENRGCGQQI